MKLYLVRHAEAVERTETLSDAQRHLTAKGRLAFREIARRVREAGASPDIIFTSPLLRAVQTAEILSERLKFRGDVLVTRELAPGFDHRALRALLDEAGDIREAAFVGHEPDLGMLSAYLLSPAVTDFPFRKGAVIAMETGKDVSRGNARFLWRADGRGMVTRIPDVRED